MKEESKKQRQMSALIQREFSAVLKVCGEFIYGNEPMVTVTRVRMSSDMGIAYIYVSVYNALYKQGVIKELWDSLSYLRGELGKRIGKQVRHVPSIKFFIDDTLDQAEGLNMLLAQMNDPAAAARSMKEAMEAERAKLKAASEEDPEAEKEPQEPKEKKPKKKDKVQTLEDFDDDDDDFDDEDWDDEEDYDDDLEDFDDDFEEEDKP